MRSRAQIYIAGFLTWLAGYVDAAGYIALLHIYTANMSGNSVSIGIQLWDRNWMEALLRAWPVAFYVIRLLLGRLLLEIGGRLRIRPIAAGAFCIEIIFLLPVIFSQSLQAHSALEKPSHAASVQDFFFIGLLAVAMGLQNATLTHFSSLTLHTGFVTGTLVKLAEQFTKWLTWSYDEITKQHVALGDLVSSSQHQKNFQAAAFLAAVWTAYVIGAFCGAVGHSSLHLKCLFIPIAGLMLLAIVDLRTPLALKDEEEQLKLP